MAAARKLVVRRLGLVKYMDAVALQNELVAQRREGVISDTLLSLQHPPTYTVGKRGALGSLKKDPKELAALGAELHFTDRGGDITFHGPGQAVLYPILSLRDLRLGARRYVEGLEDVMIRAAGLHGVLAQGRMEKRTGVWVGDRKIGAIGVRISGGGFSSHGLAFNIRPDLNFFSHIVPCGIDMEVTSLEREVAEQPAQDYVTEQLIQCFADVFGFQIAAQEKAEGLQAGRERYLVLSIPGQHWEV